MNIPHVKQPQYSNMCGAACLEMVYSFYGAPQPMAEIWPLVRGPGSDPLHDNCHTNLMTQHALNAGFKAIAVTCDTPIKLVNACLSQNIAVIALLHSDPSGVMGHYCIITGISYKGIFLNDSLLDEPKGHNRLMKENVFLSSMQAGGTVSTSNTFLLIAPASASSVTASICHDEPECCSHFELLTPALDCACHVLCPQHDCWCLPSVLA